MGIVSKVTRGATQAVKHPLKHPLKLAALLGGGFLLVDYFVQPKGHYYVAKAAEAVMPSGHRAHPGAVAARGMFGPGWGQGLPPYGYGGHYPETPAQIALAHNAWAQAAAAQGMGQQDWTQSAYPWA